MTRKWKLISMAAGLALGMSLAGCSAVQQTKQVSQHHPQDQQWKLVWSDEFVGSSLDPAKWSFEQNCWGGGNNEQQCYTDRQENAEVRDGKLHIRAIREDFTGSVVPEDWDEFDPDNTQTLPYTSARVRTVNKGDWRYGRFEIRAKMPAGQGTWPAIWMLPTDSAYGGWAASGEIDIMEAVNLITQSDAEGAEPGDPESRVHGTLHYGQAWPNNVYSGTYYDLGEDNNPADEFHHYAIEWEEGEFRWYVNGHHYATQTEDDWYTQYEDVETGEIVIGEDAAPFDQEFHLIMNLAVGGDWAGNVNEGGIDESVFPQEMVVDYVRVYQCDVDPATGKGCATVSPDAEQVVGNEPPVHVEAEEGFGEGPVFTVYDSELATGLNWDAYNPNQVIAANERTGGDDTYMNLAKTGGVGNFYAQYSPRVDLSHWRDDGDLVFDLRVNSRDDDVELLVKLDSGWPNVSDVSVPLPEAGTWSEVRLNIADLEANGNSLGDGQVDLADVINVIVFEPTGVMDFDFANVRFEEAVD